MRLVRLLLGLVGRQRCSPKSPSPTSDGAIFPPSSRCKSRAFLIKLTYPLGAIARANADLDILLRTKSCGRKDFYQHVPVQLLDDLTLTDSERLASQQQVLVDFLGNLQGEDAMQQHISELEERIEELDSFAHTVAHDIKNTLSPLIGFATALKEDYAQLSVGQQQACLDHLVCTACKLSNVVDELLLLAEMRKADVVMEPLCMATLVAQAQERLAFLVKNRKAEIILPASWPMAEGYGPWIEEVWVNYLSNAIKYGGQPPRVELGAHTLPDGMICFWVCDNGPGLTLDAQARLFKPFIQLEHTRATGHGLGLSVVQHIVNKLGGQVGVASIPGQGSTFSFALPAHSFQLIRCGGVAAG
jgi:signal transduction histidine kinase